MSNLSFERISDTFNRCSNGLFGGGALDAEGVGRGTGLGLLYALYFLNGTNYCGFAMTTMHILNAIDRYVGG